MHEAYGITTGLCRDCCNFTSYKWRDRTVRKCIAYGDTRSEATDWRASNSACGLYNVLFEETGKRTMLEMLPRGGRPKEAPVCRGQIGFKDLQA